MRGFRYCDLIMAPAERAAWRAVLSRSTWGQGASPAPAAPIVSPSTASAHSSVHLTPQEKHLTLNLAEAERRANYALPIAEKHGQLLSIALDHLTLARVALYRALLSAHPEAGIGSLECLAALDGLRKAGALHHLPRALLTAALHHHFLGDPAAARRYLDEAQQIAERGPMPLYLADVHLHRARLFRDKAELAKARTLIERHHYGRRTEELADAEAAAQSW